MKKRIFTEQWKKNISIAAKNRYKKFKHPMLNKHHSEKARTIIGQASKEKWQNPSKNLIEGSKKQAETKRKLHATGKLVIWNKGLRGIKTNSKGGKGWNKGLKTGPLSLEHRLKITKSLTGRRCKPETRRKISEAHKGSKNPFWKGGVTKTNYHKRIQIMSLVDYKIWRSEVYERDNYTCQICGINKILHANHIKKFSDFPELRFDINNGITLCKDCHISLVNCHEKKWESYFNFNLETRGYLESNFIPKYLNL